MEARINKMFDMLNNGFVDKFLNELDQMAASKAYLVIRDRINTEHIRVIKNSGKENYQLFQDIKQRAKKSWDYDHKVATIEEVNRACMNVYQLALRLMRAQNDDSLEEFNKIKSAINRIEEKIGIESTVWVEEATTDNITDGGTDNVGNVQGVEENS